MTLEQFFQENNAAAIAFSGGVDSAFLLAMAARCGARVKAYYVKTAFQPQFELEDACRLAKELDVPLQILPVDILCHQRIAVNPADRCYHCKKVIFEAILKAAKEDGYGLLLDGTNASDDAGDRPGMRVLTELSVRSPLRECGLHKEEVRRQSKALGLFTWDKPAYACLATRIPAGEEITRDKLERTERAESYLESLDFRDFRVRSEKDTAKLQVTDRDFPKVLEKREAIIKELKRYYQTVLLDLEVRK